MNRTGCLLLLIGLVLQAPVRAQAPLAPGIGTHTDLFNAGTSEGVACYRIPALVTAPNGDLIAAIDERVPGCGDLKWSRDINIVMRRSSDGGQTWTGISTVADLPLGQSASDPSMIVDTETGDILMFYNFMDLDREPNIYYFHMMRSADNGATWTGPVDITGQISKPAWREDFKFITSGRGIQTRSGRLLHTLVNLNSGLHVFGSDDHGANWFLLDTAITPGDESKLVELDDGRLMINSRVNGEGLRFVHVSDDDGQSWHSHADSTLVDPGCNASIIRYTSVAAGHDRNRLLFANANDAEGRKNLTVRVSYDEGATWTEGKTVYEGSSAYSTLTVLPDGDIGLLFEKDEYTENVFVRFSLDWLTDGADSYQPAGARGGS